VRLRVASARPRRSLIAAACAGGLVVASACGSVVAPSGSQEATGQVPQVSRATLQAFLDGHTSLSVTPVTASAALRAMVPDPATSKAAAMRVALAQHRPGSKVLGVTLARVRGRLAGLARARVVWLASVDPYGGEYGAGGPPCGADNSVIEVIDPATGKWIMGSAGKAPGVRPLPVLGPRPRLSPGEHCQDPVGARNHKPIGSWHERVAFEGVLFTLPAGWATARPGCGRPANDTVVISYRTGPVLFCPVPFRPASLPTSVTLTTIFGPRYANGWPGRRIRWHGQPAWLAVQAKQGVTTITLTLPWLDAAVAAESPHPARARALLRQVSARTGSGLEVPPDASSVFIQSLAGQDGDGQRWNATITGASDVRRVLADLRSLRPTEPPRTACDGSWCPDTALLTVHASHGSARTYAARFGGCGQVIAGTGRAATVSDHLLADIKRLVPHLRPLISPRSYLPPPDHP
jgi:hypothetical protein